ncbi:MAG: helix-turn-helix domain-containing protein [Defluviicoccus sp.]|nr:helix-turn-helix domain-containing protein [Defluviicoccus sp.]
MENRPVGHPDPVDPATVWNSEPGDFVPWLMQPANLKRLGNALGLDLEAVAREAPVGRFRADIVCRDRHTDGTVVIEAQLGTSDHSHLGQLLTYAEGLEAHVVVWLGTKFHDEHRAAVGRLNRSRDLGLRCFAVAFDLWRMDDSRIAVQFTVLAAPRDWPGPAAGTPGHRPAPAEADTAPAGVADRPPLAGNPIRIRRLERGLSLKQVARAAGLSPACVAHIETGRNKGTPKTLAAIEYALNMPPGALGRDGQQCATEPETGKRRATKK